MKILVDIGHPAHVHFFKIFIRKMEKRGHEVVITARKKEVTFELLNSYGFRYVKLGVNRRSLIAKLYGMLACDKKMVEVVKKFRPEVMLSLIHI